MQRPIPVVADINVLIDAVVSAPDRSTWATPPPVRGEAAAVALAVLNQGLEFGLWLSPHVLDGTRRVLVEAFGFAAAEAGEYEGFLLDVARRTGGVIDPSCSIDDCPDWEDNRILELAEASGALLVVSSDDHLVRMSPWRGTPVLEPSHFVSRVDAMRRQRDRAPGKNE